MKKLILCMIFVSCIQISCKHESHSEPKNVATVVNETPSVIEVISVESDSLKSIHRLMAVKRFAVKLFTAYSDSIKSARNDSIKLLLSQISFWNFKFASNGRMALIPLEERAITTVMFGMMSKEDYIKARGEQYVSSVVMSSATTGVVQGKMSFNVVANKEKMFEFDTLYLASSLIHEIVHVMHRTRNPSMKRDNEFESWTVQTAIIKSALSPQNRVLWETKLLEQRQKPYDFNQLVQDNDSWIMSVFGNDEGFMDKFCFDVYGKY